MISQAQNNERLTTAITTLDYHTLWNSLHAAHSVGFKERGTNVIAADVMCNGSLIVGKFRGMFFEP